MNTTTKKNYSEAISWYDKAIELDPKFARAWSSKGSALNELGEYQEAIKYLDKAIELDPNFSMAWNNKGYTLNNFKKISRSYWILQ